MIIQLFYWWYGLGWLSVAKRVVERPRKVAQAFSTTILLKTLFAPWRRVVTVGGRTIDDKIRGALDNLISRTVGFFTRLIVLIAALFMVSGSFVLSALIAIAWPLVPIISVVLIVKGLV